MAVLKETTH